MAHDSISAFPVECNWENGKPIQGRQTGEGAGWQMGMTLRDYFAAKAIIPLLDNAVLPTKADRDKYLPMLAEVAYEMADAMLEAREE